MERIRGYCPASLSFIFKSCPNADFAKSGSIGLGCTVNKGVVTQVSKSTKTLVKFNNSTINFPTCLSVLKLMGIKNVKVEISSTLPLGYGFGISGAASLSLSLALNKLFLLNKNYDELVKIAHTAEIINKTGLGSVATQANGGFLLKKKAGIPSQFIRFPFEGKKIYAVIISKIETPKILKNISKIDLINKTAEKYLRIIHQKDHFLLQEILDISYEFAQSCRLINASVKNIIDHIKKSGGHATMAMLGNVIFSDIKPVDFEKLEVLELKIITDKARLL